jgi:exodeoxyribonuclease V
MTMILSDDQQKAVEVIIKWFNAKNKPPFLTLGGYAGTGKTTLMAYVKLQIAEMTENKTKIAFCSYTGKASQHLKNRLVTHRALTTKDHISTIHGLIYTPIENKQGVIVGWEQKDDIEADLVIVDEASMLDEKIWQDLLSYNVPILAIGDHGQLPPIKEGFNLMQKPMLLLEHIHRQAAGDPIIEVSKIARETGVVPPAKYSDRVIKYSSDDINFSETSRELLETYNKDTLVLCGYNATRNKINQFIRGAMGFEESIPQPGDRVICLRNNHKKGIYNGMLGTVNNIRHRDEWFEADILMDDTNKLFSGRLYKEQFGAKEPINFTADRKKATDMDLFDFGYALTVHKAQGSQAQRVILFEERFSKMDDEQWRRWLYTGITRAQKELYMFGK